MMDFKVWIEKLRDRFWIIPSIVILLEVILLWIVCGIPNVESRNSLVQFFSSDYSAEAARLLLTSIATSIMTVVGVLFSLTIVILQQVSSQYSPRVIGNFIKSISSQLMLGVFSGTFLFCLLALRRVHARDVPEAAISTSILLAVLCIGFLIHYVDHIVHSIQSTTIVSNIREDTLKYWRDFDIFLQKNRLKSPKSNRNLKWKAQVRCASTGYFQSFRPDKLIQALQNLEWEASIQLRPGDYCERNDIFLEVVTNKELTEELTSKIKSSFFFACDRTHIQDPRLGINQLVDIALRALSPGINDPGTAKEALYCLGTLLIWASQRPYEIYDLQLCDTGTLRLKPLKFHELISESLGPLLITAEKYPTVLEIMISILKRCSESTTSGDIKKYCHQFEGRIHLTLRNVTDNYSPLFERDNILD